MYRIAREIQRKYRIAQTAQYCPGQEWIAQVNINTVQDSPRQQRTSKNPPGQLTTAAQGKRGHSRTATEAQNSPGPQWKIQTNTR